MGTAVVEEVDEAVEYAAEIGYPVVVRPSYVLGGRAMEIVYTEEDLRRYMREAVQVSNDAPVLLDRFLDDAIEVDVDAVCDGEDVFVAGIMQHIEQAGVHSGDSACSLPPFSLSDDVQEKLRKQMAKMAKAIGVVGLMNTQFAIQGEKIFILEVNPRASRTGPFVSKAIGLPVAKIAARCMVGQSLVSQGAPKTIKPDYFAVKEAVFPFAKFQGVDPTLGPEMKSTGEVMGVGRTFAEAFLKSQMAAGEELPTEGKVFISVRKADRHGAINIARMLSDLGFELVATRGTAREILAAGLDCTAVNKVREGRPHIVDMIINAEIGLIVNTTEGKQSLADSYTIRREALLNKVAYTTTLAGGLATCEALRYKSGIEVYSLQALHEEIRT